MNDNISKLFFSFNCQETPTDTTPGVQVVQMSVHFYPRLLAGRALITQTPFHWLPPTKKSHPTEQTQQTEKDITTQHCAESCCSMSPFSRPSMNYHPPRVWETSPSYSIIDVSLTILFVLCHSSSHYRITSDFWIFLFNF